MSNSNAKRKEDVSSSLSFQSPIVGEISLGSSLDRRWQTVAMFSCSLYFILPSTLGAWMLVLSCLFRGATVASVGDMETTADKCTVLVASLLAMYMGFILIWDQSPTTGSRRPFLRNFRSWWNHSCDYLPLLLVKTAELPVGKSYVLGYHPHGIISVGCFGAFATDGARAMDLVAGEDSENRGFSSLFPGLDRRVITLPQNFQTPLLREYFLHMGALNSDKQTFRKVLSKPDRALVVVVGGAAESLETQPGALDLILEKRRGFVREAIMAQASLVPVIGFGENDLYHMVDTQGNTWITTIQAGVKRYLGLGMPIFAGRSMLFKDFGVMPQRKPVVVVVGAPIPPPRIATKFQPQIDRHTDQPLNEHGEILKEHHAKYVKALKALHDKYKNARWNQPGRDRRKSLMIVR